MQRAVNGLTEIHTRGLPNPMAPAIRTNRSVMVMAGLCGVIINVEWLPESVLFAYSKRVFTPHYDSMTLVMDC